MGYQQSLKVKHDIIIVGGGVSGTALLYTLSKYTDVRNIGLIEKYLSFGLVNSASTMNSQTLHFGDIETNYSLEKAIKVKRSADMIMKYLETGKTTGNASEKIFSKYSKMVLGVGKDQVDILKERYKNFAPEFPHLRIIGKEEIGIIEPRIMEGRNPDEELLALVTDQGYTVDFGRLSHSFVNNARKENPDLSIYLSTKVEEIIKEEDHFKIITNNGEFEAQTVVVAAGSHSLILAKSLGYGKSLSILSIAGSFYIGPKILKGKVYTIQDPKLPFAAIHGDPEVHDESITRFGPTAKPIFFLERYNRSTFFEYWKTFGFSFSTFKSIWNITVDKVISKYLLRNIIYDIPSIGKRKFLKEVRKIVPNIELKELKFARKIGGTRPQIVNNATSNLEMGEAKLLGEKIIFNITPSPGASTCLGNAYEDTITLMKFLDFKYNFNKEKFERDLVL